MQRRVNGGDYLSVRARPRQEREQEEGEMKGAEVGLERTS